MPENETRPCMTPGPWRWELNPKSRRIQLCGGDPKRHGPFDLIVMDFERWGFQGATPRLREPIREHLNIMVPAHKFGEIQPGREHHADWFRLLNHPDAQLIEAAPELLETLQAFWLAVKAYDRIGFEGSDLLEKMSDAWSLVLKLKGVQP